MKWPEAIATCVLMLAVSAPVTALIVVRGQDVNSHDVRCVLNTGELCKTPTPTFGG